MKKMKKLLILFLLASVTIVSCNKDDDSGSGSIEGNWEFSKYGGILSGQEFLVDYEHTPGCNKDFIEIKSGGAIVDHYFYDDGDGCYEESETGTWVKDGNSFLATYSGYTEGGEILELNNTTLKVKATDPDTNEVGIIVFTRK
ncbi:lipocalin family protein [Flavobacterium ponti]|jgi:hypothetical protein|uniref:Lipocalin family protein n=1 Tax=Flavobacterium ponti TaxID=665133 RepID=A0ABV9P572_9FLAO